MAQPTGCESTELHGEEETTPREGAMPRRTSSRDSETTIVESVFTTLDHSTMANATKKQLVDELRAQGLRCSGRKDELIARIIRDNIPRQALKPTDSSMKDQAAYDDDRQAHLETLSADNARLCAELSSLRAQLNRATTSEHETLHEAHQNASLPTERVATPTLGLHHSVSADITMSSGSTRPPSLNDSTNQDAARPATPTVSTNEGKPSMAQILAALVNTQALLANALSRGPPTTSPIQIHSTSDTSSSIPLFDGTPQQSAYEWITQVERIAALAHWTPSLTLVTAASRLTGSAKDWHSAYGSQYDTWEQWKEALILRFKQKLTMQEFLELQTKRRLQSHETIVEYMYSKNAILNKAPYRLAEEERISLILSGMEDDTWANPLAAQLCGTVTELIDRAALLDARRRTTMCAENDKKPSSSTASRGQGSDQRMPASSSANLPKANPRTDFSGAPHPRPISARSCFNCGDIGHLSRDCRKPKTPATIRAEEKRAKRDNSSHETGTTSPRQANCFLHSTGGTLLIVSGTANNRPVRVCIDSGANLSIMSANALTDDIPTNAWVSRENIEVLNRSICPTLAATLDVTLGTTNVRLEDVVVTELPSGIDLILGSDWRRVANVDCSNRPWSTKPGQRQKPMVCRTRRSKYLTIRNNNLLSPLFSVPDTLAHLLLERQCHANHDVQLERDQAPKINDDHLMETCEVKLVLEDLKDQRQLVARAKKAVEPRGFLDIGPRSEHCSLNKRLLLSLYFWKERHRSIRHRWVTSTTERQGEWRPFFKRSAAFT
ncbi:hypothetical protein HPB51_004293 [Rhipicephalus microplus]|uniref:CCHC-type domain-containing protein n=1 Tax=Rhipicephalus microplus TaxID=6941 RepID=A0A9J6ELP8_RHIMP|nr:hypothetical protein HPB51_004293 [Rhipicephalus microplus]